MKGIIFLGVLMLTFFVIISIIFWRRETVLYKYKKELSLNFLMKRVRFLSGTSKVDLFFGFFNFGLALANYGVIGFLVLGISIIFMLNYFMSRAFQKSFTDFIIQNYSKEEIEKVKGE